MAGETQALVNAFALLEHLELRGIEGGSIGRRTAAATELWGKFLHSAGIIGLAGGLGPSLPFLNAQVFGGHQGLQHDLAVFVSGHFFQILEKRLVAGFVEGFNDANAGHAHLWMWIGQGCTNEGGVELLEPFQGPERVHAGEVIVVGGHEIFQGVGHRGVALEDEQFLSSIAPPTVGMGEASHQLCGRFLEHLRLWARFVIFMDQTPNAAAADGFIELVLLDDLAQVGALSHPVAFLNDASVHIHDVERTIGRGHRVDRPEVGVRRADEFRFRVRIAQERHTAVVLDHRAAHEPSNRFAKEQVAQQLLRQPVASINFLPAGGSEMVQRFFLRPETAVTTLHIGDGHQRIDRAIILRELIPRIECPVHNRHLKIQRTAFAAGVHVPRLAVIILREAPLTAVVGRALAQ